jgi:hypothetical protein
MQFADLRRRQDGGRLVQDQYIRAAVDQPQDLHRSGAYAPAPLRLGIRVQSILTPARSASSAARAPEHPFAVDGAEGPALTGSSAQDQVFQQCQPGDQREFLMHHADSGADRRHSAGLRKTSPALPLTKHRAGVRGPASPAGFS